MIGLQRLLEFHVQGFQDLLLQQKLGDDTCDAPRTQHRAEHIWGAHHVFFKWENVSSGERHRLSLGICVRKGTIFEDLEKNCIPFTLSPQNTAGGGGRGKSTGERSIYRDEHIYFIHMVNLLLKHWICCFRYFRRESVSVSQAHFHTLND